MRGVPKLLHERPDSPPSLGNAEFRDPAGSYDTGDGGDRGRAASRRRNLRTALASLVLVAGSWLLTEPEAVAGNSPGPEVPITCIQAPDAGCVFDWSADLAAAIPDPFDRAAAFMRIAEAQALAGRTNAAQENLFRALSSASMIGGDGDIVRELTKRFDDEIPYIRAEILTRIASAQLAIDEPNRAWRTLSQALAVTGTIRSDYWRAHQLILIAQVQAAAGAVAAARASIAAATADGAGSSLGHALRESAAAQAAAGDFEGAVATASAIGSDSLRDSTFADIAGAQANAGDDAGALVTVERIEKTYFRMLAMNRLGWARAGKGNIEGAERAAERILELWEGALEEFLGRDTEILYSDTLEAIAKAHVAAGAYKKALSLAANMPDPLSIVDTHAAVATAQISAGALKPARITAQAMCTGRHLRYGDDCVEVLTGLASAYARAGDREAASEAVEAAAQIADRIIYYPDRTRAFTAIWKARILIGDVEDTRQAFDIAIDAADDTDDMEARRHELVSLALTAARTGKHDQAARAFSAARTTAAQTADADRRATAVAKTAVALAQAGKTGKARQMFSEALAAAASIQNDPYRNVAVLAEIAVAIASVRP